MSNIGDKMNVVLLKNLLLEALRLIVCGIPGILLFVASKDPTASTWAGGAILVALKALDRGIHEDPNTKANGILPF